MVHAAKLAGQADLADGGDVIADGLVEITRRERHHGGKVCCGLVHAQSADDVQERVTAGHLERAALFEHRHQHGGAVVVKAVAHAPGIGGAGRSDQSLNLRQHRPGPLHGAGDAGAGRVLGTAGQQHL